MMKDYSIKICIWTLMMSGIILIQITPAYAQNFTNVTYNQEQADEQFNEVILVPAETLNNENIVPIYLAEGESNYTLGKADVLEINVQRHPEVSGIYSINMEGKIQYEFVGDIYVEGLTKDEISTKITEMLSTYIVSPTVTVKIAGYNSKVVYVIGEVARPGKIFMRGDTIKIREALVQAGLPLLSGSLKKTKLITPTEDGKPKNIKVDLDALLYKGDLRENLVMNPGDTLYIPATGLTKVMRAISPVTTPISSVAGTGRTFTTGF